MASTYKCDGCGKEAPAEYYGQGDRNYHKPRDWYQRCDADGAQDACSRECIETVAAKTKKTSIVLPV